MPAVVLLGAAGGLLVALDHPGGAELAGAGGDPTGTASGAATSSPSTTGGAGSSTSTTIVPSAGSASSGGSASTTTTVPSAPGTCTGTTVTGSAVQTRYGPVQVQAVVASDGTLCSVTTLKAPSSDRKSVSINSRAVPTLTQRALAAGGADFSAVSGATITSNAYRQSLQSVLDRS